MPRPRQSCMIFWPLSDISRISLLIPLSLGRNSYLGTGSIRNPGAVCSTSNDEVCNATLKLLETIPGKQKGDPAKAMEALVDTVKGEGLAKGKPWPGLLVLGEDLGEDAEHDLRDKCQRTIKLLDEWKEVCNF
ncbi:hypothetical protein AX15_005460 [Amanita polypyramis BW_CC]|nr:hypothetical protein AX15_005460 [Amanita polypyramis BW_CC]